MCFLNISFVVSYTFLTYVSSSVNRFNLTVFLYPPHLQQPCFSLLILLSCFFLEADAPDSIALHPKVLQLIPLLLVYRTSCLFFLFLDLDENIIESE